MEMTIAPLLPNVADAIYLIRGQRVILDSDLAARSIGNRKSQIANRKSING
jgi:hypothetical protein